MMKRACVPAVLCGVLASVSDAGPVMTDALWSRLVPRVAGCREHFVAPDGTAGGAGTKASPWDLASTLGGRRKVAPGGVVWLRGGRYVFPVRNSRKGGNGFAVRLGGAAGKPIHLRAAPGERATIDGGLDVAADHLWIWDLEIALADRWRPEEPAPAGARTVFNVPTGVLNVTGGVNVKLINCLSHNNTMGVGFWKHVKDGEIHGCIIYDNGFVGADRPHGPAIYTQNTTGTPRLVTDNILGGNFSLAVQCYASRIDQYVNHFTVEGNVICSPRKEAGRRNYCLLGGDRSKGMVFRRNVVHGYRLVVGTGADQVCEGNLLVRVAYSGPTRAKNTFVAAPAKARPFAVLRPNKYDPRRAHLVVSNWSKAATVRADLSAFLKKGRRYRILNPFDFYGPPLAEGIFDGGAVAVPLPKAPWEVLSGDPREVGVFVVMKEPPR